MCKEIPEGKMIISCELYNRKEKTENPLEDVLKSMFDWKF